MLNINGKNYEIKLTIKTIKQIETVLNKGLMAILKETGGMFSITELTTITGYGLYNEEGNRISPVQGMELAEEFLLEKGYAELIGEVVKVLERDCPFFFQVD